jgi:hypothetical protein
MLAVGRMVGTADVSGRVSYPAASRQRFRELSEPGSDHLPIGGAVVPLTVEVVGVIWIVAFGFI